MNEIAKELLDELRLAVDQMELAGDCIEAGRNDEALLLLRSLPRIKRQSIAKAEAALAKPQADEDGWIPWDGGKCPVSPTMLVEVKLRSGHSWLNKNAEEGSFWGWYHGPKKTPDDIIAYRPLKI